MEVSVESLSGLNRRVTVLVQHEQVEEKVQKELQKLAARVQMDGFRKGKAPLNVVKQRYSDSIRLEVAQELLKDTLDDALESKKLVPISTPEVDKFELDAGKDFQYSVTFEVYPEFEVEELTKKTKVELIKSSVTDEDVIQMIERLREQHKGWQAVSRKSKSGDQVNIDFKGFVNDEPFENGSSEGVDLVLGSHQMIPGFEDALIGHKAGESFSFDVTFPEVYQEKSLAGQTARFDIVLHEVREGLLPDVDAAFVSKFGVKLGDIDAFRVDIRSHMDRELDKRLREINHDRCFSALAKVNEIELPTVLIDKEIETLKHELYHQIFGAKHSDHEKIPDFPRELFEDRAKKRVHLGLIVSEYVKKHRMIVDDARVEAMLDRLSSAYDDPVAFKTQTREDKQWMAEIEAIVLEQMIAERILETTSVKEEKLIYDDVMNYKNDKDNQKE
ncbi:MAG: trigger factor [Gammaproteobacteria bacterium]|nr:trigger factor [Gammaproteobacteria bacterium]